MDDQTLYRVKLSAVVGGMLFIFFQLLFNFGDRFSVGKLALAFVIFIVGAAATFFIQAAMNKG